MSMFAQMSLPPFLAQRLLQAGITSPSPIQEAAIPPALAGRDVMAVNLVRLESKSGLCGACNKGMNVTQYI
jgi:hypothetical protein